MRTRALCFCMILLGLLFALIIGCGQPKPPTPTFIPPMPTPSPAPTVQPPPTEESVVTFSRLEDLLSAYASARGIDQSMTPRELHQRIHGPQLRPHGFPRIVTVLLDADGNAVGDLGFGGVAFPIDRFVVAPTLPSLGPDDLPPPLREKNLYGGTILIVGERPDGAPDYEVLKGSRAKSEKDRLEIFERKPNPRYPFTPFLPLEIQDLKELAGGDPLIFYGYTKGFDAKYYQTEKRGNVSTVSNKYATVVMNGSVTGNDFGAPVFSLQCGVEKLVGITAASYANAGDETEAFVVGIKEALKFVEENTGVRIEVKESKNPCPPEDPVLKQRVIQALSDGNYDFSYDLCDLKDTCDLREERQWVRPFQEVWIPREDSTKEFIVELGNAVIVGSYVAVISSSAQSTRWFDKEQAGQKTHYVKYRILWGGRTYEQEDEEPQYEYLKFIELDSSRKIAVFERLNDPRFPASSVVPFQGSEIGNSGQLKIGNALLTIGYTDLRVVFGTETPYIRQTVDPASVIGFSASDKEVFHIQGQRLWKDHGAALCALRDGDCEFVGLLYAPVRNPQAETLNTVLTIEFVLKAMKEVVCSRPELVCPDILLFAGEKGKGSQSSEIDRDKARIVKILQDQKPDSTSLLFDLVKPDLSGLAKFRTPISILFFDETGKVLQDSRSVPGKAIVLSDSYLLTSAELFLKLLSSDSKNGKKLEAHIALPHTFLEDEAMASLFKDTPLILETQKSISDQRFRAKMEQHGLAALVAELENLFSRHGKDKLRDELSRTAANPEDLEKFLARSDVGEFFEEILGKTQIRSESELNAIVLNDAPLILEIQKDISSPIFRAKMEQHGLAALVAELENLFSRHGKDKLRDELSRTAANPEDLEKFLARSDVGEFFEDVIHKMQILDIVVVDQENGYALLKKSTPGTLGKGLVGSLPVVSRNVIELNQEILLAYSQDVSGDAYRTADLVSPGTITSVSADFSTFIVNAFVSPEILGAPIYAKCDGQVCAVGLLTRPYPIYFEQIKTEGFGVSLDFIFEQVKKKTGIDLSQLKRSD